MKRWKEAEADFSRAIARLDQLEAIERPIVQVGFGGLGLTLDPALFAHWPEHWFVMAAPADPSLVMELRRVPNLTLLPSGVRPLCA